MSGEVVRSRVTGEIVVGFEEEEDMQMTRKNWCARGEKVGKFNADMAHGDVMYQK